jgi:hypothetical protein
MIKKNTNEFIKEAKKVHGDKYDYSLVEYKKNNLKVKIICPIHGEFEQSPSKHINAKQNCPNCSNEKIHNKQRKNINDFIKEAKKIHGDKYDYFLSKYVSYNKKINIICPIHGEFNQTPNNHLNGKGCKYCGGTSKLDTKLFIINAKKIHGNKYDYSKVNYIDARTNIKIICPKHGEFEQSPNNHISKKQGCYDCLGKIYDTDSFIKICSLIHNNKYNYSLVDYVNSSTKVKIICSEHGEFEQRCDTHRNGAECPKCLDIGQSKNEINLYQYLISIYKNEIIQKDRSILSKQELDIYIPNNNIAIEYNGLYWHNELNKPSNYHLNKTKLCEDKGIKLIHIFEDEWIHKKDIVKSRLKNILGLTSNKIYARKCIIKNIDTKLSKEFLNTNHIQGHVNSSIKLGLYYNDELVSIMTFGSLRKTMGKNKIDGSYELLRFCNKLDTTVIGGANKLLSHFIKNYNPNEIISYADRRWSNGNLYEKLGFEFSHNSKPNYWYVKQLKREYRFKYRKNILVKEGYDPTKSEHEIMLEREIYRIYDCGNKCYKLTI